MTKKILSLLLSFVLLLSSVSTVFAADNPKNEFSARLLTTLARLASENKTASRYGDTNPIAERLAKSAYEYVIAMNIDMPQDLGSVDVKNSYNALPSENKFLDKINVAVKSSDSKPMKFNVNIYGDKDKLALNVPNVSDEYYYLNKTDYRKWDNSEYASTLGIDSSMIKMVESYFDMLMFSEKNLENYQVPKNLSTPYLNLFKGYLEKGTYRSDGSKMVNSGRGYLAAQKYTFTVRGTMIENFKADLIALIKKDSTLNGYLNNIYGSMTPLSGGINMTDLVIESVCELIDSIEIGDYLRYSIYVSNNGYIISHEFTCGEDNADEYYFFKIDTTGEKYLLDELNFSAGAIAAASGETMSFDFNMAGSHVGPDGIFNSKFSAKMNMFGETSKLFNGNFYYDATKSADNFNFTAGLDESLGFDGKIVVPGSINIDNANNTIVMDFSDIKVTAGEESFSMGMYIKFAPTDASAVEIPSDSQVNVLEMSEDDISELTEKIEDAFGGM